MLKSLLLFLGLIGVDTANYDPEKSEKLEVVLNECQIKTINKMLQNPETQCDARSSFKVYLESMIYDSKSKSAKLIFRFK